MLKTMQFNCHQVMQLPNEITFLLILNDQMVFFEKLIHVPMYYKVKIYSKNDLNNYNT